MKEIFKTNNLVELSWVKFILNFHKIEFFSLDESMSITEGNISAIPVRILVKKELYKRALLILEKERKKL